MLRQSWLSVPRSGPWLRVRGALCGVVLTLLPAGQTHASPSYSPALARALDMRCPPACTLCHTSAQGGLLTANTPFGIAVRRANLPCCDANALPRVLATLEANATDSDQDDIPDVLELRNGTDPNSDAESLACAPSEPASCALSRRSIRQPSSELPVSLLFLSLMLAGLRRVGRRAEQSEIASRGVTRY